MGIKRGNIIGPSVVDRKKRLFHRLGWAWFLWVGFLVPAGCPSSPSYQRQVSDYSIQPPSAPVRSQGQSLETIPYRNLKYLLPTADRGRASVDPGWTVLTPVSVRPSGQLTKRDKQPRSRWGMMVHRIRKGETLYKVAQRYYGEKKYWRLVYKHNRDTLESPQDIKAGQLLYLPTTSGANQMSPGRRPDYYIIDTGDSLARISQRVLGNRNLWKQLLGANREWLSHDDTLSAGVMLKIPR